MVVTRLFSIKARWCNLCSAHNKDRKCDLLLVILLCFFADQAWMSSVFQFAIIFYRWCAKEVEVEEVLIEENFETETMKRNNLRVFKCSEKWKDRLLWLSAEDGTMFCSHCKEFDKKMQKQIHTHRKCPLTWSKHMPAIELWLKTQETTGSLWANQKPQQAETINWLQNYY